MEKNQGSLENGAEFVAVTGEPGASCSTRQQGCARIKAHAQ